MKQQTKESLKAFAQPDIETEYQQIIESLSSLPDKINFTEVES